MNPSEPKKQKTGSAPAIVQLNMGGHYFSTTRATLLQSGSSYFARLLEDDNDDDVCMTGALRDEQGRLFIDRDPTLFAQILDYLRNLDNFSVDSQERDKLHKEALYYQLDGLVEMTRPPSTGYDENGLFDKDQGIRRDAQLARANLRQGTGAAQADQLLIDLLPTQPPEETDGQQLPLETLFDQPASSPECCILFDKRVERARREQPPNPPASIEEFQERLVQFGGPLLQNFPMDNVVIAGGAVLSCLQGQDDKKSDVDVFLLADTPQQARVVFDGIVEHLSTRVGDVAQAIGHQELLVTRSPYAVTFCVGEPQRHIQLILIRRQCVADVLLNFDIDCCQVAWDGSRVLATPSALRALQTGINICDPERASGEYEWRLAKYAMRGFLVAVPGLDPNRVKEKFIRNSCFGYHQGHLKRIHLTFSGKERPEYRIEEDTIVEGLALLLVLSTAYYHGFEERAERGRHPLSNHLNRRLQQGEARLGLSAIGSLGMGNYLLDYAKMERMEVCGNWKIPTPPAPPPVNILRDIAHARWVDTAGTEILPLNERPHRVFRILNGRPQQNLLYEETSRSSMMDDIHQKRLICYDLLQSGRGSNECPNVLDASRQYPAYPFPSGRGRLTRFLEFPSSTDVNSIPWTSGLSAEEWTRDVYESSS